MQNNNITKPIVITPSLSEIYSQKESPILQELKELKFKVMNTFCSKVDIEQDLNRIIDMIERKK